MGDIFRAFEKFLFRDLSFLLGGSVLLYSIICRFDHLTLRELYAYEYFIWAGISYTIGYSVQDLFTLLRIVRTKADLPPSWIGRRLYYRFEHKYPTQQINSNTYKKAKQWLYEKAPERFRYDYERIESLKQVGTAVGPCFFLAGLLLISHCMLWIAIGLAVLGIILILLGWLKVTQQPQHLIDLCNSLNKDVN